MAEVASSAAFADSEGPNASLQQGQVGQAQQLANGLKSTNPAAYAGSQQPNATPQNQGNMSNQGGGGLSGVGGQPPPQTQPSPATDKPYDPSLAFPDLTEHPPWAEYLKTMAAPHLPYLSYFADVAAKAKGEQGQNKQAQ